MTIATFSHCFCTLFEVGGKITYFWELWEGNIWEYNFHLYSMLVSTTNETPSNARVFRVLIIDHFVFNKIIVDSSRMREIT